MPYTNSWTESAPTDSSGVRYGAQEIRKLRTDVRERLAWEAQTLTSNTTLGLEYGLLLLNTSSSSFTVNLPSAIGIAGREFTFVKINSGSNIATIVADGSEMINESSNYILTDQYEVLRIRSDGSNWVILIKKGGAVDLSTLPNSTYVGDGSTGNKTIYAKTAATNKPFIRYNDTTDKWEFSDDGSNTSILSSPPIGAASVSQSKLKTSTGSVSIPSFPTGEMIFILPGGSYGFFPQILLPAMGGSGTVPAGVDIDLMRSTFQFNNSDGQIYPAALTLISVNVTESSAGTFTVYQRYVTSSGTEHWVFVLYSKDTDEILTVWEAPDHPSYGSGGSASEVPHPFFQHYASKPDNIEIALLDMNSIRMLQSKGVKEIGKEVFSYTLDMSEELPFIPRDMDGTNILFELPAGVTVRRLKEKPTEVPEAIATARQEKKLSGLLKTLRSVRNKMLSETDWTQSEDAPLTNEEKQEWKTVRQELRDFPVTFLALPVKPETTASITPNYIMEVLGRDPWDASK